MKNLWIVLLLALVAVGAFLLGRHSGGPDAPAATAVTTPAAPDGARTEPSPPEPVRTFRGPDGRAHIIVYDDKNPPDSNDPAQVRKALLSDMKYYPTNIERNYDLAAEDLKAMLAGSKPIPEYMLPAPGQDSPGK